MNEIIFNKYVNKIINCESIEGAKKIIIAINFAAQYAGYIEAKRRLSLLVKKFNLSLDVERDLDKAAAEQLTKLFEEKPRDEWGDILCTHCLKKPSFLEKEMALLLFGIDKGYLCNECYKIKATHLK